jgi:formate hydrogenlyase subunit 4
MSAAAALALHLALLLLAPPLMVGLVGKTKAWLAGRRGPPLWQPYRDLWKLFHKGSVRGEGTTWVFGAGPVVALAGVLVAGLLVPLAAGRGPLGFAGDVIAFAALLSLGRFFTMAAALDTGSSFEGMGASREAAFGAFAEPALFLALALVCLPASAAGFAEAWAALPAGGGAAWLAHPLVLLAAVVLFVVLLAENSRIPIDDPATHLELTMVHEVMVLDHGGPDLAFVLYGEAVKLFVIGALLVHLLLRVPAAGGWTGALLLLAGEAGVAVLVGAVEGSVARLRLPRVPGFLIGAAALAAVGVAVLFASGQP